MQCSFCDSPAAHPATGCVYGPRTIACRQCCVDFWAWLLRHVNKRPPRKRQGANADFYAAAGKWRTST